MSSDPELDREGDVFWYGDPRFAAFDEDAEQEDQPDCVCGHALTFHLDGFGVDGFCRVPRCECQAWSPDESA